jgi:hypothetical protein
MKRTSKEPTYNRQFTEEHLAKMQVGATRKKEEQIVGNWIRAFNPVLYAELLLEATAGPRSQIFSKFSQLEEVKKNERVEESRGKRPPLGPIDIR